MSLKKPKLTFAIAILISIGIVSFSTANLQAADPPLVDRINLKNGGVLYGTAKEVEENKQRFWLVTTVEGSVLKLKRSQVANVIRPSEDQREYLQRKNSMVDTLDAHWQMQQWCVEKRLKNEREFHLLRIIELDPDHKDARAILNYKDYDGVWIQRDHFMSNQGYVKDSRGVFRLPVAMDMHERKEGSEGMVSEWTKKTRGLMTKIIKRNDQNALRSLKEIKEPAAVPGLVKIFEDNNAPGIRKVIVDILGQIESRASQIELVKIATTLPDTELDLAERCVNLLKQPHFDPASTCGAVMHWLRPPESSGVDKNWRVNRAAWLIGKMEFTPAIRSLIDALNTVHMVPIGGSGGNTDVGFGNDGTAGLSYGKKPTKRAQLFPNHAVLDTLRLLSPGGVDFNFNEAAWIEWYVQENRLRTDRLGRDR